jgi:hypothetical protein
MFGSFLARDVHAQPPMRDLSRHHLEWMKSRRALVEIGL